MAKNTAIAWARISTGKISLTVRYAALAPADAKKKMTDHAIVCVVAVSTPWRNSTAVTASIAPDRMYVLEIITRRPTVSNNRPIVSGPARLPTANAIRYHGADFAETW